MLFGVATTLSVLGDIGALDGVELRCDYLEAIDLEAIAVFMKQVQKPVLFTLRGEKREKLIEELFALSPAFFDLDAENLPLIDKMAEKYPNTKIICSFHDYSKTPEDLEGVFNSMQTKGAYAYKIAVKASSTLDALAMLTFTQKKVSEGYRFSGISMGKEGHITRILGPVVGNFMDYAPLVEAVAEGQLGINELLHTYRYKKLGRSTSIYGLIGERVDKSLSSISHNKVFDGCGIDAVYVKMRIKKEELASFFSLIRQLPFKGLSVTMPLKEEVAVYLDEKPALRSVNTIWVKKEKLYGTNTDGKGTLDALEERQRVADKKMVVLGAGGAAYAIVYEALQRGAHVAIINRSEERGKRLAEELGCRFIPLSDVGRAGYEILVNATSSGMAPQVDEIPIDPKWLLPHTLVMDIITRPRETLFLKEASKKGCRVIGGIELFVNQATEQFVFWFGEKMEISRVKEILKAATEE